MRSVTRTMSKRATLRVGRLAAVRPARLGPSPSQPDQTRRVEMSGSTAPVVSARPSSEDEQPLVPVQRELLADMLTPVSAYARLCPPGQLGFLLESVEGGERLARYSYIGHRPQPLDVGPGDPLRALARIAAQRPVGGPGLP